MLLKDIKHNLVCFFRKKKLTDSLLFKIMQSVNNLFFHRNERMVKKLRQKNAGTIFYVIRMNSMEEGLLSMYFRILVEIDWALDKGYIPFVDLQNNKTQYTTGELINGTKNAWEYFFHQPSKYDMNDVYTSKNIILSGKNRQADKEKNEGRIFKLLKNYDYMNFNKTHEIYEFIIKNSDIQGYIYKKVECLWHQKFEGRKIIGVFGRGTDYVAFKPKGHHVQPTKEYLYEQLMILKKKYYDAKVFLVTEDDVIYNFFKENLNNELIEIEDIRFPQYKSDDYLFKYCKNNSYEIGLQYLVKLLLLARCNYLVASIASGSEFANIMNNNQYEEKIVIDLGIYQ